MIANTDTFIENSQGIRAFVGDRVYLAVSCLSWTPEDKPYVISEIHSDGTIIFDNKLFQHTHNIVDFETAVKMRKEHNHRAH